MDICINYDRQYWQNLGRFSNVNLKKIKFFTYQINLSYQFFLILWSTISKLQLLRDGNNFLNVVSDARCLISTILKVPFAKVINLYHQKISNKFLITVNGISGGYGQISTNFFFFLFFSKNFSIRKSSDGYLQKPWKTMLAKFWSCLYCQLKKFQFFTYQIKSSWDFFLILWSTIFKLQLLKDGNNFLHAVSDTRCLISPTLDAILLTRSVTK